MLWQEYMYFRLIVACKKINKLFSFFIKMWVLHEEMLPEKDEDNNHSRGSVSSIQAYANANHEKLSDLDNLIKKTQN